MGWNTLKHAFLLHPPNAACYYNISCVFHQLYFVCFSLRPVPVGLRYNTPRCLRIPFLSNRQKVLPLDIASLGTLLSIFQHLQREETIMFEGLCWLAYGLTERRKAGMTGLFRRGRKEGLSNGSNIHHPLGSPPQSSYSFRRTDRSGDVQNNLRRFWKVLMSLSINQDCKLGL